MSSAPRSGVTEGRSHRAPASELRAAKEAVYREHILKVAERVFAEQGFINARMQDIARSAGISLATLYQSYPGKRELHRGVLIARDTEMFNAVMAQGQAVLFRPRSVEQLLWLMQVHLHFLLDHPDYLRMQLHEGYAWYHGAARPSAEEQQMWERGLALLEQVFGWGVAQGLLVPGKARDHAHLLMAMQQTRLANWVMDGMLEAHDVVVARAQADFVRQFCRPAVAAGMLSEDGAGLSEATRQRMAALEAS